MPRVEKKNGGEGEGKRKKRRKEREKKKGKRERKIISLTPGHQLQHSETVIRSFYVLTFIYYLIEYDEDR